MGLRIGLWGGGKLRWVAVKFLRQEQRQKQQIPFGNDSKKSKSNCLDAEFAKFKRKVREGRQRLDWLKFGVLLSCAMKLRMYGVPGTWIVPLGWFGSKMVVEHLTEVVWRR